MVVMSDRLSRRDWLDHGLKSLAREGPSALRAEPLAKKLGVSRGSFYWHFKNLADFHQAVAAHWRAQTTEAVIAYVEQEAPDPGRLNLLMKRALTGDDRLERAIRAWGAQDASIAETVAAVDHARVDYLAKLLGAAGVNATDAAPRAQFLYWANLGRLMIADQGLKEMRPDVIDDMAALLKR